MQAAGQLLPAGIIVELVGLYPCLVFSMSLEKKVMPAGLIPRDYFSWFRICGSDQNEGALWHQTQMHSFSGDASHAACAKALKGAFLPKYGQRKWCNSETIHVFVSLQARLHKQSLAMFPGTNTEARSPSIAAQ